MNPPPNLAVSARVQNKEIGLLPRHWEWLAQQPRSASATLRMLVENARLDRDGHFRIQAQKELCYFRMRDLAGDRPNFEDACRALFADQATSFRKIIAQWPETVEKPIEELAASIWVDSIRNA